MIEIECDYSDPPHVHEYPDDWQFGGADELDPRADPRWKPTTYTYTTEITVTQVPLCDDQAIDEFTRICQWRGATPRWVAAKRPGEKAEMLPWLYDADNDTVYPAGV
jgi:hypothetical protein